MDITTLAAWGEFLGGIAVVVSLVYLASQIRQNSRLLQVSATMAVATGNRLAASTILDEPSLGGIWTLETAEFESLPEIEQARLGMFVGFQIVTLHRNYNFQKDGVIKDDVWKAQIRFFASLFRRAWLQKIWSDARFAYRDKFGDFMDNMIREGEAAG